MRDIYQTIPHRPPFLFLDKIIKLTDEGIVALREIRKEEPQFEGHYPGNPIMPGVLLCESVFQAAAVYLVDKMEKAGERVEDLTPILARIADARFKQMVLPGDEIEITANYKEQLSKFHFLKGTVRKDGKIALTIEFALALIHQD